jgi:hypothetical protein
MPLEAATYISDLVPANPIHTDPLSQADSHMRLTKQVLKNTFPNVSSAVSATGGDLSHGFVPVGGVIMWTGSLASIPAGWLLCDGTSGVPDLRDRFVVAAGGSYSPAAVGGSAATSFDGFHSHLGSVTDAQGTHTHATAASGSSDAVGSHSHGGITQSHVLTILPWPSRPLGRELGAVGIIKDNSPTVIPPNAFSDGINVRFTEKKVSRAPLFRTYFSSLTGSVPVWCYGLYNQGGYDS